MKAEHRVKLEKFFQIQLNRLGNEWQSSMSKLFLLLPGHVFTFRPKMSAFILFITK